MGLQCLSSLADLQACCSSLHPHSATNDLQAHDEQLPGADAADRQTPDKVRNQEQAGVAARRLGESQRPRQPVPQMNAPDTKQVRGSAGGTRGDHLPVCSMSPAGHPTGRTHVISLGWVVISACTIQAS